MEWPYGILRDKKSHQNETTKICTYFFYDFVIY